LISRSAFWQAAASSVTTDCTDGQNGFPAVDGAAGDDAAPWLTAASP